jgi:hypothetical protein
MGEKAVSTPPRDAAHPARRTGASLKAIWGAHLHFGKANAYMQRP